MADTGDLKSPVKYLTYGFESRLRHQSNVRVGRSLQLVFEMFFGIMELSFGRQAHRS